MASNYYRNLYYGQVENNQILSKEYMNLKHENKQLKEKIDKAIDYIKEHQEKQFAFNYEYGLNDKEIEELLEILGDKENEII